MHQVIVDLRISADEWLKVYRGAARTVRARARDGRQVQFPASILSRFLTRDGIAGTFAISFDEGGRFVKVDRLG